MADDLRHDQPAEADDEQRVGGPQHVEAKQGDLAFRRGRSGFGSGQCGRSHVGISFKDAAGAGVRNAVRERLPSRTRISQKAITANGAKARTNRSGEPRTAAGSTSCWPRKKEPVAMKKAKHIRQR